MRAFSLFPGTLHVYVLYVVSTMQAPKGAKVVDASGKFVMPGGIDPHTHLDSPMFNTRSCDSWIRYEALLRGLIVSSRAIWSTKFQGFLKLKELHCVGRQLCNL